MDRILIILKKKGDKNGPRASSAPALELNTIIFKHVFWYICSRSQVGVYRTIGPLVISRLIFKIFAAHFATNSCKMYEVWQESS